MQHRGTLVPEIELFDVRGEVLDEGLYKIEFLDEEPVLMVTLSGVQ